MRKFGLGMRIVRLTIVAVLFGITLSAHAQFSRETSSDAGKSVSVYPNPAADDYVFVKMEDLDARNVKVMLYNIIGNEIRTEVEVLDQHEIRMRIKDLSAGYYLIALREDGAKFRGTYKFLKR